ncbi:MAG: two-component sensor histidine kinase [Paucibacter sp.]|nr:two-component sensor histidine kinase [Roseateles sp.]
MSLYLPWLIGAALAGLAAALLKRLQTQVARAERHAFEAEQLRLLAEELRSLSEPAAMAAALAGALTPLGKSAPIVLLLQDQMPATNEAAAVHVHGEPDANQWEGLWLSMRRALAFGPGTLRHEELNAWYLPLRGREGARGAAMLPLDLGPALGLRAHAQALCDLLGQALERAATERAGARLREAAEAQGVRNTLLATISHDYRTPLATIMSAASSLLAQGERLDTRQRERLARSIVDEARSLSRMTDNTLQLARLDGPDVRLTRDWESAEELIGAVMGRLRQRDAHTRVKTRVVPGLPLLRCDALLLTQLLDNLVDNALKYAEGGGVEILARREEEAVLIAVRDRGPGVPPAWRDRIFEVFRRGPENETPDGSRGSGVGLAACRAIATAHGGRLGYRARSHGGAAFELRLPIEEVPQ